MVLGIVISLLLLSGLFSGMNLGFMSLSKEDLQRKIRLGDKRAGIVYNLRKNGNRLLCTILVANVFVNSLLALYLGELFTGPVAVILSTALLVIFGEILPQAICSRYPLEIGSRVAPVLQFLMYALYIICWPMSRFMDYILGPELPEKPSKGEIGEMIKEHIFDDTSEIGAREGKTALGALKFSELIVEQAMTPKKNVFKFYENDIITEELIKQIHNHGHTRIPIFKEKEDKVIGIVLVKNLVGAPLGTKVTEYARPSVIVNGNEYLDDVLDKFKKERIHLFVVSDEYDNVIGIITLEDVLEEVFQFEVIDETDKYVDMREKDKKVDEKIG